MRISSDKSRGPAESAGLWCVNAVNQQHRGGETGTGGREGGRARRNWQKKRRRRRYKRLRSHSVCHRVCHRDHRLSGHSIFDCPPSSLRLKDHCPHFPFISSRGRRLQASIRQIKNSGSTFHARICPLTNFNQLTWERRQSNTGIWRKWKGQPEVRLLISHPIHSGILKLQTALL